jgi:hypothetical protein
MFGVNKVAKILHILNYSFSNKKYSNRTILLKPTNFKIILTSPFNINFNSKMTKFHFLIALPIPLAN